MTVNSDVGKFLNNLNNIQKTDSPKLKQSGFHAGNNAANITFKDILKQAAEANNKTKASKTTKQLSFSKHAQQRLLQRDITINDELINKINSALEKAAGKNIKNVLLISEETAFIVSVDNNVVVTAMNNDEMKENVITKIDGTVII